MTAIRPKRDNCDDFFIDGDVLSYKESDIIAYIVDDHQKTNDNSITRTSVDFDTDNHICSIVKQKDQSFQDEDDRSELLYPCCAPNCNQSFSSIFECEEHYIQSHTFQCQECKCVLPNEYLLDLHLLEAHDAYFQTSIEHKKVSYSCLVEHCPLTFSNPDERFLHLQTDHGYPKWFRFHSRAKKRQVHNFNHSKHIQGGTDRHRKDFYSDDNMGACTTSTRPSTSTNMYDERKEKRRQRRIDRNKNTPCKFHQSKRGCRRGDRCMFLHEDRPSPTTTLDMEMNDIDEMKMETEVVFDRGSNESNIVKDQKGTSDARDTMNSGSAGLLDAEMEELVDQIQVKARISVPAKISFGKRRR